MRRSSVVLAIGALCCVCFALNLNATSVGAVAFCMDFSVSQDSQKDADDDLTFEFDANFDDVSDEQESSDASTEDSADVPLEFDSNLDDGAVDQNSGAVDASDVSGAQASVDSEKEKSFDSSDELEFDFDENEQKTNDSVDADAKSDDAPTTAAVVEEDEFVESDEFEIDEKDVLGSAFNGLIPTSVFADETTFDLEKDCAIEHVGVFSAGEWLKERVVERKVARETERARHASSEVTPDEYKTIEDFFATLNERERKLVDAEKEPKSALEWLQFSRKVAKIGRLEFAKRALEESFFAETGDCSAVFHSYDGLENDARLFRLDDEYVRLERGAFERLCLASYQFWSDSSRFNAAFLGALNGSEKEFDALVRGGDYGAVRFCRLSLNKFADFKVDARGNVAFGKNTSFSASEFDAYLQLASSYFERVGFGAPLAFLGNADAPGVEALVHTMKFSRDSCVRAELGLLYYDETLPQSLRQEIGRVLQLQNGKIPTPSQVVIMAYKQAFGYYTRSLKLPGETFPKTDGKQKTNFGADAKTFIWRWNDETQEPTPVLVTVEYANLYEAARLARAANKLATERRVLNNEARALAIASTSELLTERVGADAARAALKKFEAACPNLTTNDLAFTVQYAIKAKRCRGALIPMILLGDCGNSALFNKTRNAPSIIVQGSTCADRRVRYEALRAVCKNLPQRDFDGSRVVIQALEWFKSACGERVVVVLEPESGSVEDVVKRLEKFGFVVKSGKTVHEMLTEVKNAADLEFIYLPDGLSEATLQTAAKTLRLDQTTAETPLLAGVLDESADAFDLEADKLAGLRFYDSVFPSNVSRKLRARQAKCAAQALEVVKKIKDKVLNDSEEKARQILDARAGASKSAPNAPAYESTDKVEKKLEPALKHTGKVNFKK